MAKGEGAEMTVEPDPGPVVLAQALGEALMGAARAAMPHECCGLLLGIGNRIDSIIATANVADDPARHFAIDPRALIDAHRAARAGGPQVLGYYHSHPAGPASPSATDRAEAAGDGRIWAIIEPGGAEAAGDVTFWRDDETGFTRLAVQAPPG
jgi:proteasome lid subunit RPN8/RPN11